MTIFDVVLLVAIAGSSLLCVATYALNLTENLRVNANGPEMSKTNRNGEKTGSQAANFSEVTSDPTLAIDVLLRRLQEAEQRAHEGSRAKSAFLANMSHELRSPLNSVIGLSEILSKELFGPIGTEQYKGYAADIHESGNRLLELINSILDMSKVEAGRMTLVPSAIDVQASINHVVRLTEKRVEAKGLALVLDTQPVGEIEADSRAVIQMLLNLVSNAIKFTERGSITIVVRGSEEGVTLFVKDTGRGIGGENFPRIGLPFEQFDQSEFARENEGLGLGLALTKALVEMHGGSLEMESEVGKGTTAKLFLPRRFRGTGSVSATGERVSSK